MMAFGRHGDAPQPAVLPTLRIPLSADLDRIRVTWRLTGLLLIVTGTLYLVTIVFDSLSGQAARAMPTTILTVAFLIGGASLLAQRYSAGPDTVRRSHGILGLAIGIGSLVYGLRSINGGVASGTDFLMVLSVVNLVLGSGLVLIGALSLWSRRYAAWYQRRWDNLGCRRNERLGQRR
jgi:hypothetical protein